MFSIRPQIIVSKLRKGVQSINLLHTHAFLAAYYTLIA